MFVVRHIITTALC